MCTRPRPLHAQLDPEPPRSAPRRAGGRPELGAAPRRGDGGRVPRRLQTGLSNGPAQAVLAPVGTPRQGCGSNRGTRAHSHRCRAERRGPAGGPCRQQRQRQHRPRGRGDEPPGALRHQRHREGRRRLPASPLPGWALPGGCPVCHLPTAAPPGHFLNLRAPGVGRCREKPQALWEGTAGRLLAGAWPWAAASDPGAGPRGERAGLRAAPGQGATVAATGTQGQQEPPLPGEGREKSDRPAAERRTLLTVSGGQRRAGVSMQGAGVAQGGTPTKSGGVGGHQQSWKVTHFSAGHHTSCFTGDGSQRPSVPGHPRDAQAAGTGPHAQQRGAGFLGSWICRLGGRGSHTVRSESVGKEV